MTTNNELTLEQALEIIRGDGQRVEQQSWDNLWVIYYDTSPNNRHATVDLTEADVIKYAETIRLVQDVHLGRNA